MFSNIGFPGLLLLIIFALFVFGPNKLPQIGRAVGRSLKEFKEDDFALLAKSGIKRNIFDYRAKVYLVALASAEEKGFNLEDAINEISKSIIMPIKKQKNEPTWDYLKSNVLI